MLGGCIRALPATLCSVKKVKDYEICAGVMLSGRNDVQLSEPTGAGWVTGYPLHSL